MLELVGAVIIGIGVIGGVGTCMAMAAMLKSGGDEY
jgi:hypothetical protein